MIGPPKGLGLPAKYKDWYPGQEDMVLEMARSGKRVIGINAPTGSGKSAAYMAAAINSPGRTAVITMTKGLMQQLSDDFEESGLVVIKGQNNYICTLEGDDVTVDEGPCHAGQSCHLRGSGCDYFDALRVANRSRLVDTNYSYWLHQFTYGEGLGRFDTLILDEAHNAPWALASFLTVQVHEDEFKWLGKPGYSEPEWIRWASAAIPQIKIRLALQAGSLSPGRFRKIKHLKRLLQGMLRLSQPAGWIMDHWKNSYRWDPIWPAPFAELLLQGIKKVIMVSATITPKDIEMLGVEPEDYEFHTFPSRFETRRRPIIHIQTEPRVNVKHNMSLGMKRFWMNRIDRGLRERQDVKSLIHTVSYERARYIMAESEFRNRMIYHDPQDTLHMVEKFKRSAPGTILISPVVVEGWDFPHDQCRYQIISKVPFPDTRSKLLAARSAIDKEHPFYLAMRQVMQSVGRGMRAPDDWCETHIIDDNWGWFISRYKKYASDWFLQAVKRSRVWPVPLGRQIAD